MAPITPASENLSVRCLCASEMPYTRQRYASRYDPLRAPCAGGGTAYYPPEIRAFILSAQ
jgi:hypothetical protein